MWTEASTGCAPEKYLLSQVRFRSLSPVFSDRALDLRSIKVFQDSLTFFNHHIIYRSWVSQSFSQCFETICCNDRFPAILADSKKKKKSIPKLNFSHVISEDWIAKTCNPNKRFDNFPSACICVPFLYLLCFALWCLNTVLTVYCSTIVTLFTNENLRLYSD